MYLIHPPDRQGGLYNVFWALGRAIQPLGDSETLTGAKAMADRHSGGE
jgi:hypothetical protein